MPYNALIVANAILHRARERGVQVDHMKLQKLVFLVHAWSLALRDTPAVDTEPEAWTYGPVFGELYSNLRNQGRANVTHLLPSYNSLNGVVEPLVPNQGDQTIWQMVDQVLGRYGHLSAIQLSSLSHEPGGPWDQAQRAHQSRISNGSIRDYYQQQFNAANARI